MSLAITAERTMIRRIWLEVCVIPFFFSSFLFLGEFHVALFSLSRCYFFFLLFFLLTKRRSPQPILLIRRWPVDLLYNKK